MTLIIYIYFSKEANNLRSRYFRYHGLKLQVILLPNGMIGNVFITSLVHNDMGVLKLSGLSEQLLRLLRNIHLPDGHYPALFVDGIFTPTPVVIPRYVNPTPRQERVNACTSSLRMENEHIFGI